MATYPVEFHRRLEQKWEIALSDRTWTEADRSTSSNRMRMEG